MLAALFASVPAQEIKDAYIKLHGSSGAVMKDIDAILTFLAGLKPSERTGLKVVVEENGRVWGSDKEQERFALGFTSWKSWLTGDVVNNGNFANPVLLAHIFDEMTYYGPDDDFRAYQGKEGGQKGRNLIPILDMKPNHQANSREN